MRLLGKKKLPPPVQRILVIRFSSIGDIVLTTPVIRSIKHQYPNAELHFLVKKNFRSVVDGNPYIDVIHELEQDLNDIINQLRQIHFDIIIDLQKNFRSARVRNALQVKSYTFPKLNVQKWLYINFKWNTLPDKSIVHRYFKAVEPLGVKNDGKGLDYFIDEDTATQQDDIPMGHWAGFVGCVIGGSFATKQFPIEKWRALLPLIPYPVILLGGPEDREAGIKIAAGQEGKVYNACGKFNLTESAHLVKRATVIVSNDTGLMHIAAAWQKPIVSLWGNTTPWLGMFPYYGYNDINHTVAPESVIVEHNHLSCRPCSKIGFHSCPKKHFKCMNELNEKEIAKNIIKLWEATKK